MKMFPAYLLSILMFSSIAQGAVLVDTGTPSGNEGIVVCRNNIPELNCDQSVALKVSLSQATSITDIQSHFALGLSPNDLTLALYSDANNLPGEELFNSLFSVGGSGWNGLNNLNWGVDEGNYWVVFEVRDGQYFLGALSNNAPNPLEVAFTFDKTWYHLGSYWSGGLIVEGTPIAAVPEPESYAMILAGLGVLGIAARRRKSTL